MHDWPISGYYRVINDDNCSESTKENGFVVGELAYVHVSPDKIHVLINDNEWTFTDAAEFHHELAFVPDGPAERQRQIMAALTEIDGMNLELGTMQSQAITFAPHVEQDGELSTSTALVPRGTSMSQTKAAVAGVRNRAMKLKKEMTAKSKKLQAMVGEQAKALKLRLQGMEEVIKKMEEAVWTINLYLGKDEEIHVLRKGKAASEDEKITIRQRALYMDEECALHARNDGIDVRSVDAFDKWILAHPENLTQILPETKGIVALHIKRSKKEYGDPWVNQSMNAANLHWTYFLIRNGENLYRVYADIDVGGYLLPVSSEFEDLFWTTKWNEATKQDERTPLKPGSKEYMKAMDAVDARNKHYLRVLLVLQGLMDRTPIFKPMPTDQINLCDPSHCAEWLNLIYEAENVLTDGKPTFSEWQELINQKLEVGHRIIGVFDYKSGVKGNKDRDGYGDESRIYPRNANYPDSNVLHTIEEREGDHYVFRYERTGETIYTRHLGAKDPEVRARCWVERDDDFILNFDAATMEELEYYKTHRLSRIDYKVMAPLLETAVALKRQEEADEAPFRLMLGGEIIKRYGADHSTIAAKVDELVKWWKFKNRTHRALLSDDVKAANMIVEEHGLRSRQEQVRAQAASLSEAIVQVVGAQTPAPVLIAHKSDNKYVAYVPHNDQNVWVTEQTWTHNRQTGDIRLKEAKPWKLVDKRHARWQTIYAGPRWAEWKINPVISTVLTDPELKQLAEDAIDRLDAYEERKTKRKNDGGGRFLPLCVYHNADFEIVAWYSSQCADVPTELILTNEATTPEVERVKLKWVRTAKGVELEKYLGESGRYSYNPTPGDRPWDGKEGLHIIKQWEDNQEVLAQEHKLVREQREAARLLRKSFKYVPDLVADVMYERKVLAARREFDAEFGDPELWEDHLKELKIQRYDPSLLEDALRLLVERGVTVVGMTLGEVYEQAVPHGLLEPPAHRNWWGGEKRVIPKDVPMDFVIPPNPKPAPDEPDEDD